MNLFFDVDYTLLGVDGSLRPGTKETFLKLKEDGHTLYVWSGIGVRTQEVQKHGLSDMIAGVYRKPLEDFEKGIQEIGVPVWPDLVVDDYPEIVIALGGIQVKPYYFARYSDKEMERIYRMIREYAVSGFCDDPSFKLPPKSHNGHAGKP